MEKVELDLDIRDKGKSILGKTKQTNKKNPAWQRHSLPVVETVNGSFYVQYRVLKVNTEEKL